MNTAIKKQMHSLLAQMPAGAKAAILEAEAVPPACREKGCKLIHPAVSLCFTAGRGWMIFPPLSGLHRLLRPDEISGEVLKFGEDADAAASAFCQMIEDLGGETCVVRFRHYYLTGDYKIIAQQP